MPPQFYGQPQSSVANNSNQQQQNFTNANPPTLNQVSDTQFQAGGQPSSQPIPGSVQNQAPNQNFQPSDNHLTNGSIQNGYPGMPQPSQFSSPAQINGPQIQKSLPSPPNQFPQLMPYPSVYSNAPQAQTQNYGQSLPPSLQQPGGPPHSQSTHPTSQNSGPPVLAAPQNFGKFAQQGSVLPPPQQQPTPPDPNPNPLIYNMNQNQNSQMKEHQQPFMRQNILPPSSSAGIKEANG